MRINHERFPAARCPGHHSQRAIIRSVSYAIAARLAGGRRLFVDVQVKEAGYFVNEREATRWGNRASTVGGHLQEYIVELGQPRGRGDRHRRC